ncbi:hypothetical protein [Bartonella bacilliformis]|uniref:hypothetical protein n=1 Tax=Bartonella bacilliformis TaxID=774 RepID=UPI0005A4BA6B
MIGSTYHSLAEKTSYLLAKETVLKKAEKACFEKIPILKIFYLNWRDKAGKYLVLTSEIKLKIDMYENW